MPDTQLPLQHQELPASQVLERIRAESRDTDELGGWFEQLVCKLVSEMPQFDVAEAHLWQEWADKEQYMPGVGDKDIGVDAVARLNTGQWVAVQCKCYSTNKVNLKDIEKFLGGSQHELFDLRWLVSTSPLGPNAITASKDANPQIAHINFWEHMADQPVSIEAAKRPIQDPWPEQQEAIDKVVKDFETADRGKLIMACGTGKTFTSERIAEHILGGGTGHILFAAPSIALVSQARREWLRQTTTGFDAIVVCSDKGAGRQR